MKRLTCTILLLSAFVYPQIVRTQALYSGSGTVIFTSDRSNGYGIYVADLDGKNLHRLNDDSASDGQPAWSPNGKQISYVSRHDGNPEIYVMDIDGQNQHRLTTNEA